MPITRHTQAQADDYLQKRIERIEQAIIREYLIIGEEVLNIARNTEKPNTFKDQTGNLRSSLGYVVAVDGQIVNMSSFEVVKDGQEGSTEGKAFAENLVKDKFRQGIVLILVAGMNYAYYVKKRGYDVHDSAVIEADSAVEQLIDKLHLKVE